MEKREGDGYGDEVKICSIVHECEHIKHSGYSRT